MEANNKMELSFLNLSENEGFARTAVSSFIAVLDPTVEELTEIKTALSEAVSNAIIHGYDGMEGMVTVTCSLYGNTVELVIKDQGLGIENVEKAREPLYTSKPEQERSGMGFTVMEIFMDKLEVASETGMGTTVKMVKHLGR